MILEIITPDKNVFNGEVSVVTLPGKNGEFQILKDHAPLVSTLAKGNLTYDQGGKSETLLVDGGVIEVSNNKVLVLAEAVLDAEA
ncbi:ATP synthase F1 subunit epsilon [Jiulongibacter sediminis]|jgi:F-type H+-transporting ATPase subunit epsilon|uniref:ATP synthase subunit epsilon n=1 Tax=Jiulongibacter sediminis TaxID=1605367 RepID=A0A0P7BD04_9BACT|nr:ATP synthase F1 subunit epsilon [Jiulongibacter sediminis]KPM48530.1 ATP synthase subunit epsilon [Jiulongibacter sediminis]TBX25069.1 ATP synthase subunit epsilon [Jiulongibacter sediminis]